MLRLETLGGLRLTDGTAAHLMPQRRRLALLALLAAGGERGTSRDKLVAMLWSESSSESARHALEQLLYEVRRQVPGPLVLGTDPLRLDPAGVSADVVEFADRLAAGDLSGAIALARGPFLDGFFLQGAPEFERWVERERARLQAERARALRLLADQAEAGGRHTAEVDYRRLLADADPLGERAATELVRALASSGDFTAARLAARAYMDRVRQELPDIAPTDLDGLVERLRREHAEDRPADSTPNPAPYLVEREIGRGAVATVYLARDQRLGRPVALKLLRPDVATATDARRFRREIAILTRLFHPHVLQLHDVGVLGPGGGGPTGLYFVMPYVQGESLRQRLERDGQLPLADALGLACDVGEALAYAHGQGVVHRDIRPENILLEAGHALVTDFGIAGVLESAGAERLSASGIVLGQPGYASPEQAAGGREIDGRSDVYSLGSVLYEMLAGEPPFIGASRAAILARQIAGQVPSLSTVRPDVPGPTERAILRALRPAPEERFGTAGEFVAALRDG
jgi:DNA-binding SARP family transcriptional activator